MVESLDGAGGALVDACTAVDAFGCIDDSDIVAGDCSLGANVDACTACDAIGLFNGYHFDNLRTRKAGPYINVLGEP